MSGEARYQDASAPIEERVDDLLGRMTLEEKAGQMFQSMIAIGEGGELETTAGRIGQPTARTLVEDLSMTHMNVLAAPPTAREFARWHNRLQELAAGTRLGIPVTVSSDPRHAFTENMGAALLAGPFSQWPEHLGFAAIGDVRLVEEYADVVRREYLAVGIRTALHPQIDLATDPRWARAFGTFGQDAEMTARLAVAYIHGLQATGEIARERGESGVFGSASVSAMVKHFPGGGPQQDGEDPHFAYGREQVYPGGRFEEHLMPFRDAIAAGARQMMPYYGMPMGLTRNGEAVEEVGFGFNRGIVTGLLREELGFEGIVCTDWGLVTDVEIAGVPFPARAWGVEHLGRLERVEKILAAGADQLGGETCPELIVELVREGRVAESRIDASVRKLLTEKFVLGLFDAHRYVDVDRAEEIVGAAAHRRAGLHAQSRSVTVLETRGLSLPLAAGTRVFVDGGRATLGEEHPLRVVTDIADADVALMRVEAPFEDRGPGFDSFFHAGSLEFDEATVERVAALAARLPLVVDVRLERPAIVEPLRGSAAALVANYGAESAALLDALAGVTPAEGRLPFDVPSSMAEVAASAPDVAGDTPNASFRYGHRAGEPGA